MAEIIKKLPDDVKTIIAKQMILIKLPNVKEAFKIACAISETCKDFKHISNDTWDILYDKINIDETIKDYIKDLTSRQRLSLVFDTYCQKCKIPGCRKLYLPIPIRVCYDCVRKLTLNEYELKKKYNLNVNNVRYYKITYDTNKIMKSYLIKDLENMLGCKLEECYLNDYKREMADILELDPLEIARLSKEFVIYAKPSLKIIEKSYYSKLAMEKYNSLFDASMDKENLRYTLYINETQFVSNKIISRLNYEKWLKKDFPKIEETIKLYKANVK